MGCSADRTSSLATVVVCALALHACTDEQITQVLISSVTVTPAAVTLVVGEDVALSTTVTDGRGNDLSAATPTWSSDEPSVARVSSAGVVHGQSAGSVLIRATFNGVSGTATVRVVPGPGIEISQGGVAMFAGASGSPPEPVIIHVTNSGTGDLTGLDVDVRHPTGATPWLEAELAGASAPTTITLVADIQGLAVGVRSAALVIQSSLPNVAPIEIPVTLTLTGFSIAETEDGTLVSEDGTTDTLTVVLDVPPDEDVVLTLTSGDEGEVVVSPSTLIFGPENWDQPQSVAVTGPDDFVDDGDQVTVLAVSVVAEASDDAYDGVPVRNIPVTSLDNDAPPGLTIVETGDTRVSEDGSTDSFTVALTAQAATDVVLAVTSADPGEARVAPSTLTFRSSEWAAPQTITVLGIDDFIDDGDQVTALSISVVAVASDDAFDAVPAKTVQVTTLDNDAPAGITITETGDTRVSEDGTTDTFTVALTAQPATDVVLTVTSNDRGEAIVSPSTLTFRSQDWNVPQEVTVRGVDDFIDDGDQVTTLTIAVLAVVSDDVFDGVTPGMVIVTTTDNDAPAGITITETGDTRVSEDGTSDTFTVVLTAQPATDVLLTVSSGDLSEVAVSPPTLTFSTDDWNVAQTVTVTGVEDFIPDGHQVTNVTVSVVAILSDEAYDAVPDQVVSVTTSDNDE